MELDALSRPGRTLFGEPLADETGDEAKAHALIDDSGLASDDLFAWFLHTLIEVALAGSEERAILESPSSHIADRAAALRQAVMRREGSP